MFWELRLPNIHMEYMYNTVPVMLRLMLVCFCRFVKKKVHVLLNCCCSNQSIYTNPQIFFMNLQKLHISTNISCDLCHWVKVVRLLGFYLWFSFSCRIHMLEHMNLPVYCHFYAKNLNFNQAILCLMVNLNSIPFSLFWSILKSKIVNTNL